MTFYFQVTGFGMVLKRGADKKQAFFMCEQGP